MTDETKSYLAIGFTIVSVSIVVFIFYQTIFGGKAPAIGREAALYFGTSNGGIYYCRFDPANGRFSELQLAIESPNPNFIAIDSDSRYLFAVGGGGPEGLVSVFSIDRQTCSLSLINKVSSCGQTPCHIAIDNTGKYAVVSNYSSGNMAVFSIEKDGDLSEAIKVIQHKGSGIDPNRQRGPHIHSANFDQQNNYIIVADLGQDKLFQYSFDPVNGTVDPGKIPYVPISPGSGPRHFTFDPSGRYAYLINELNNTITSFNYAEGQLTETGTVSTLPSDYTSQSYASEIQVHPSGKFLYAANRGHDSIAVFGLDLDSGILKLIEIQPCGGKWPRHFGIDPTGKWLLTANERSDSVSIFRIDEETGRLDQSQNSITIPSPACLKFCNLISSAANFK